MNHPPLLHFLLTVNSPPPDPEFKIAYLNEAEDGVEAVVIECRRLSFKQAEKTTVLGAYSS